MGGKYQTTSGHREVFAGKILGGSVGTKKRVGHGPWPLAIL